MSLSPIPSVILPTPVEPVAAASGAANALVAAVEAAGPALLESAQPPSAQAAAVSVATAAAAGRQSALAPLLADLAQAVVSPSTPAPVQAAISQVLAQQTPLDPPPSAATLQQATAASGLFLEAQLATGAAPAPDLKSALLVLQQALTTWLGEASSDAPAPTAQTTPPLSAPAPQTPGDAASQNPSGQQDASGNPSSSPPPPSPAPQALTPPPPSPATIQSQTAPPAPAAPTDPTIPLSQAPVVDEAVTVPSPAAPSPNAAIAAEAPEPALAQTPPPASPSAAPQTLPTPPQALAAAIALAPESSLVGAGLLLAALTSRPSFVDEAEPSPGPAYGADSAEPAAPATANTPPAPPFRGAPTTAQPPAAPTLAADAEPALAARHLLTAASGALARQELHQIASLPAGAAPGAQRPAEAGPRWMFELPFSTPQGSAVAQFEISRDGGRAGVAEADATWRARFSIDLEPMGPVHAQVSVTGVRAGVTLWAERPATAARLRGAQAALSQGLEAADFAPAVSVQQGVPPHAPPPMAGRFLDQAS